MIDLTTENLYDHFSVATDRDSSTLVGRRLFDFVGRDSNDLIITIGDSWTWGADLTQQKSRGCHLDRLADDQYRVAKLYGNVLAQLRLADFLGLGESGSGNWHVFRKLKELKQISQELQYNSITVIGVFTEAARDFNSSHDVGVDYRRWLLNNVRCADDYHGFLGFINSQISQAISEFISSFDRRYRFSFSTNFVDPVGYESLQPWFLKDTWLQVICARHDIPYVPEKCHMVFPWVIEKVAAIFDMAPELDRTAWLAWMVDVTQSANARAEICAQDDVNFGPLLHPLAVNHECWADYLHKVLHA